MKCRYLLTNVILVVALSVVSPALAQEGPWVSSEEVDAATAEMQADYWTVERMQNAIPYPMASPDGVYSDYISPDSSESQDYGEIEIVPGVLSEAEGGLLTNDLSESELGLLSSKAEEASTGFTYPFPFTMFEVKRSDIWRYPWKCIGRLFFTAAAGYNSSCSGTSIGGRAALTAGHCVSDGNGNWHSNWIFRPAYRDYGTPESIKQWSGRQAWTYSTWHYNGSYCRDVAMLITYDKAGQTLSQKVGALGYAYAGSPLGWAVTQQGYPAERTRTSPEYFFDGKRMQTTHAAVGTWSGASWWTDDCDPNPYCFGSYQTGGCSGGPMIILWDTGFGPYPGTRNAVYGVASTYYNSGRVAGGLCSPYFDASVGAFIDEYNDNDD